VKRQRQEHMVYSCYFTGEDEEEYESEEVLCGDTIIGEQIPTFIGYSTL